MNLVKPLTLAFGGVGTVGAGLFGTYEFTKQTVLDALDGTTAVLTDDSEKNSEAWNELKTKLSGLKDGTDHSKFLAIKDQSSDDTKLRPLCKEVSSQIYSTIFSGKDEKLLVSFKKLCIITMKEALGTGKSFNVSTEEGNSEKTTIQSKVSSLKSHTDSDTEGRVDLVKELKEIKTSTSTSDDNWKKLIKWCESQYKTYYSNKDNNNWKLVKKFCKKD